MERFGAAACAAERMDDVNTYAVAFAEQADGSGKRLELQIALEFDESDREMGMDTYCLCTGSGATHYGGVASWTLSDRALEILLDPEAAEGLGVEGGFHIELAVDGEQLAVLRAGLSQVLGS